MKRLSLIPFAVALLAALVPVTALAKGASEAVITGPGLEDPITMAGEGKPGGEQLMQLAEAAGFFPATFGQTPDPMVDKRPAGYLGPRYKVVYEMPGPNNELDDIVQYLYPYAKPYPVSYTRPGQRFWTTERTRGGWYVASTSYVKDALVAEGLPRNPAGAGDGDGIPWTFAAVLSAVAVALAAAALGAFYVRRRPDTAAAG
jgi:hypothetical protein